ncbi:MAG TPA: phage holin family protein [Anaeromyxobacter sp.]
MDEHGRMDEQGRLIEAGARQPPAARGASLRRMQTKELVAEAGRKASLLVKKEIELAKAEMRADVRSEIKMASGLGVAGICALLGLETLLVALAFGLMETGVLPGWAAALLIAAVVLAIGAGAGLWGWAKRVRTPLDTTRRSLKEDVRWARERMA